MAAPRRIGGPDAKNRSLLLDAAQQLMLEEGHAAVSSRKVAERAGLKSQLVHYYFRTVDDMFLALFQRLAEEGLRQQAEALASDQPLRALWEFSTDRTSVKVTMEFTALASQRPAIRAEIARYAERFREGQTEALKVLMERYGIAADGLSPSVLSLLLTSVSRVVIMEQALGMSSGHAETLAFVELYLQRFEGDPRRP